MKPFEMNVGKKVVALGALLAINRLSSIDTKSFYGKSISERKKKKRSSKLYYKNYQIRRFIVKPSYYKFIK